MALAKTRSHKHFRLDAGKLKRAQRALRAKTETETIVRSTSSSPNTCETG